MSSQSDKIFMLYSQPIEVKSENDRYIIEGYISTGDKDLVNDVVTDAAMKDMLRQLKSRNIKIDFEHEAFRGDDALETEINKTKLPLGRIVDASFDTKGIKAKVELNPDWSHINKKGDIVRSFKNVWNSVKNKFLDAFSIAYIPTQTKSVQAKDGSMTRVLDKVSLLNVALTGNPVNPNATLSTVFAKSLDYINSKSKEVNKMEENHTKQEASPEVNTQVESVQEVQAPEVKSNDLELKDMISNLNKELIEVKSLIQDKTKMLEELKKENAELKSVIEKPQMKSVESNAIQAEVEAKVEQKSQDEKPINILAHCM